jgi:hypothetical protein
MPFEFYFGVAPRRCLPACFKPLNAVPVTNHSREEVPQVNTGDVLERFALSAAELSDLLNQNLDLTEEESEFIEGHLNNLQRTYKKWKLGSGGRKAEDSDNGGSSGS